MQGGTSGQRLSGIPTTRNEASSGLPGRSSSSESSEPFLVGAPSISLPKGGGAIRGIGEKFAANPVTGTGSMSVPIATSPGRSGFGPQLTLSYDSSAGNGPFGFGWSLSLPSIIRKTDKGLPQYLDEVDSDAFILSGAEDLVPVFRQDPDGSWLAAHPGYQRDVEGAWVRDPQGRLVVHEDQRDGYTVRRYRPRIEGLFARIERWAKAGSPADVHWRSISKDNIVTLYGQDDNSRIADPADARRIFSWLICESRDDRGNGILYLYKKEDGTWQPRGDQTDPFVQAHQRNRGSASDPRRTAQRYLSRILYGNVKPLLDAQGQRPRTLSDLPDPPTDTGADWLFEVRFDYGELDEGDPTSQPEKTWLYRPDAFSTYRPGFEVRTCRRCERVLMLHHIPDQAASASRAAQSGYSGVVRSTAFGYDDELDTQLATRPIYSFLQQVVQTGWDQTGGGSTRKSLPPLDFEYTKPVVQAAVHDVDPTSLRNLPMGLDGSVYRWVDLHGEGVPGILTEQAGAWYYKRNWSPLPIRQTDGSRSTQAVFAAQEIVHAMPNAALGAGAELLDLAGDGQPDVAVLEGPMPGLYEHDDAEGWQRFRPFNSRLNREAGDPNLRFVDLDGDGRADVLITEDDALVWHASLGEQGFAAARRIAKALDEESGPRVVFADGTQSIYLADLSGDGMTDLVRIRNGQACYWPNLGHGRFGAKVTMDNAPWFDSPDHFDQERIRLADIDGSGNADLIYLHRDGPRLYFNQSGNGWSEGIALPAFPAVDNLASLQPLDLLGNGTACLVWSSPLPGSARRSMRYVKLMGDQKPHLLAKSRNNLGAESIIGYAPSTKFYLQDRQAGKPWITRLPFPVHVVERIETRDLIGRHRSVNCYAYHHGHFDGVEREFHGFGMVEQWDEDIFDAPLALPLPANQAPEWRVPTVLTRTWFCTGACPGDNQNVLAGPLNGGCLGEYFREPGLTAREARDMLLDDTKLPPGLGPEEAREACRSLKGQMLRQEVYADDARSPAATPAQRDRAAVPYSVTEQRFAVRMLQARGDHLHAVFMVHPAESISHHYERNPADPRTQHLLTLEVDDQGQVRKQASVAYGRREQIRVVDADGHVQWLPNPGFLSLQLSDKLKQTTTLVTYSENAFTKAIDAPDAYRNPLPCDAQTFELSGWYQPTAASGQRFQGSDFVVPDAQGPQRWRLRPATEVAYEAEVTAGPCRRRIEWLRTHYRSDTLDGPDDGLLALGDLESLALPGESYRLAFTPGLLDRVYRRSQDGQAPEELMPGPERAATLGGAGGDQGAYVDLNRDGAWWVPSGRVYFHPGEGVPAATEWAQARAHFFLPRRYRDPFRRSASVGFDAHDLLSVTTEDALSNRVTVEAADYRVLMPRMVSDPNGNRSEVAFDTLGLVVGMAVMGKPLPAAQEGDTLDGFAVDPTPAAIEQFASGPRQASADPARSEPTPICRDLLQGASIRILYDVDRFSRLGLPPFAATIARETHVGDLAPGRSSALQISVSYSDGFGREIQKKAQTDPGSLDVFDVAAPDVNPRWIGSGWTIFNNKGRPVRRYEPFFSATHQFESCAVHGVSPVLFYDPLDRVVATLHPDGSYDKVLFDPWQQIVHDVNDTVARHPRDDADVGARMIPFIDTQVDWKPWLARRLPDPDHPPADSGGANPDQDAAVRALGHRDTPTTTHFDALGRAVLTIARHRVVCQGHPRDGLPDLEVCSRVELDIEGNLRSVRDAVEQAADPLGRVVLRCAYDMLGNRVRQISMEAGERWMLTDAAGQAVRAWDSRGHRFRTVHDELRRPVDRYVLGSFRNPDALKANADPRFQAADLGTREFLVERTEYGEGAAGIDAAALNLRTRVWRHLDSASLSLNVRSREDGTLAGAFDFKGNALYSSRRLCRTYTDIPDWSKPLEAQLEDERFESWTRYDALNRPIQSVAPSSSVTRPGHPKFNVLQNEYGDAGLLRRVDVWLEQAAVPASLLTGPSDPVGIVRIDYDAKGQRWRVDHRTDGATVVRTDYRYDPETFRLASLYTRRGVDPGSGAGALFDLDCDDASTAPSRSIAATAQPPIGRHCGLQNLRYVYDPAGNLTHVRDDAQPTIYFNGQVVEPDNDHVYDSLNRLIQATGREHLGQGAKQAPHTYNDVERIGRAQPNDGQQLARYCEKYSYDSAGNFEAMSHHRSWDAVPGWTRRYVCDEDSLAEPTKKSNRLSETVLGNALAESYRHDVHGNMLQMPQLQLMQWDFHDRLLMTRRQRVNSDDPEGAARDGERTYYVYDASGQRVRKVTELATGQVKDERIYLSGFEIYRRHAGAGPVSFDTASFERETLHLMLGRRRFALVETRTVDKGGTDTSPRRLIRYQFGDQLGSSRLELDEQADVISYEEYAAYGSSTYQAVRSRTEAPRRYRYTGKERDEESGLYYSGARYYAPWLGRWPQTDPSGIADALNLYQYARQNPITMLDPDGRATKPTAKIGDVAAYNKQGKSIWNNGVRGSEHEHVLARGNQEAVTFDRATGKSDYGKAQYRKNTTLTVERETALNKTHANRGGSNADNARTERLKTKAQNGERINYREEVFLDGIENMYRAAKGTGSQVTEGQINRAALAQDGELFNLQRMGDTGTRIGATGAEVDAAIESLEFEAPSPAAEAPAAKAPAVEAPTVESPASELKLSAPAPEAPIATAPTEVPTVARPSSGLSRVRAVGGAGMQVVGALGVAVAAKDVIKDLKQGNYGRAAVTTGATALGFTPLAPVVMAAGVVAKYRTDKSIEERAFAAGDYVARETGSETLGAFVSAGNAVGISIAETGADFAHGVVGLFTEPW